MKPHIFVVSLPRIQWFNAISARTFSKTLHNYKHQPPTPNNFNFNFFNHISFCFWLPSFQRKAVQEVLQGRQSAVPPAADADTRGGRPGDQRGGAAGPGAEAPGHGREQSEGSGWIDGAELLKIQKIYKILYCTVYKCIKYIGHQGMWSYGFDLWQS